MFCGRMDSQIKHMGYRIELGEIENAAAGIETLVRACVLYNEPRKTITLFYESSVELDVRKMREHLARQLPPYMVPKAYVRVESFPLTPNGKLDRKRVRELHFDG
jgi:acyl-CoA synthetase (AMP-forming)/AMP-acid ligase II